MPEHILFLTGRLAEASLREVLATTALDGVTHRVQQLGLSVAALMTAEMIGRRLADADVSGVDRIMVPGRCRGDIDELSARLGIPVVRGPDELKDLPRYFGAAQKAVDLNRYDVQLYAEITDAPQLSVERILARAADYRASGADVIDLGGLPETPFPRLEEAVAALREAGHRVSVDSVNTDELLRGGRAGADYLLSLTEDTLWIADEVASTPVLIPAAPGDVESLERAMIRLRARDRAFIADPILDPIHFGFTESLVRYRELRRRHAGVEIMMGTGNLTELTDADTSGITAILFGIISELGIRHVLTTEVSDHARRAVREADVARRLCHAAREARSLPRHLHPGLLQIHDRAPHPYNEEEIRGFAAAVRDPSYRIQVSDRGIHLYNRDGLHTAVDPFALFPRLAVKNDPSHAFYLGVELARAQIAWQVGKRYVQDQELDWGCAAEPGAGAPVCPAEPDVSS